MKTRLPIADRRLPIKRRPPFSGICPTKRRSGGFTLIELMISVVIFSLVMAAIYSTWYVILRASRTAQEAAAQMQRQRIAVQTIENSLTCIQSYQSSLQYYSFVVDNGDSPMLSFTARLPDDFPRSGRFGGFNMRRLIFTVEPPPNPGNVYMENTGEKDLVLRQYPILMSMDPDEQADPLVLARNVQSFTVECWDTNQEDWVDEWTATNSIPPMLRVSLVLGRNTDSFGTATPSFSVTRLIAVPTQMMPTVVQVPNGFNGGAPGGPGVNLNVGGRAVSPGGNAPP